MAAPPEPVERPARQPVPQPQPSRLTPQQAMPRMPMPPASPPAPTPRRTEHRTEAEPRERAERRKRVLTEPVKWALVIVPMLIVLIATGLIGRQMYRDYLHREAERKRIAAEQDELDAHPLKYREIIDQYAAFYALDPSLVASIVLIESSYKPDAESYKSARGLMQLMPDTAEWISEKFGDIENYTFDMMFDPETNIRFGCWYLGYLSNRFDGDALKIICAYHAGQGNVDAWLRNPAYSPDGVTLQTIATNDTALYAERVLRAQQVYQRRYYSTAAKEDAYASTQR